MAVSRNLPRWLVAIPTLALLAAACGTDDEGDNGAAGADGGGEVVFFSTQLAPVEEAEKVRTTILAGYDGEVDFIGAENYGAWVDRITAEAEAGDVTIDLLGGLHGDYVSLGTERLTDVSDLQEELSGAGFDETFLELARLGTDSTYYIPWMQATYIMVANTQALDHLPDGADVNELTYEEYAEWAANIFEATGQAKVGFPAGEDGLLPRFFEGYLLPAFTGGLVTTFNESDEAWDWMRGIWEHTHPQSVGYGFMQDPLLSEEVWVAWDHVARLKDALEQRPDDFVAFPAPAGPEGRAYMPVLAGLAIPQGAPNADSARSLIEYISAPDTQAATLREVGFFPVVAGDLPEDVSPGVQLQADAVAMQTEAEDALPSLLPIGLGDAGGDFNKVFVDTFTRIVLNGEDTRTVLEEQSAVLDALMQETGAPCWEPDPESEGPCQVG
jgi:multiple sugar transport system substrate-binding protein